MILPANDDDEEDNAEQHFFQRVSNSKPPYFLQLS